MKEQDKMDSLVEMIIDREDFWKFKIASSIPKNLHHEIDDIYSSAIEKAVKNVGKYDNSKGKINTWFGTLLRNTQVDYFRKKQNKVTIATKDSLDHQSAQESNSVSDMLRTADSDMEQAQDTEELKKIIDSLFQTKSQKFLLVLWREMVEGYSYEELVERHSVPMGTVKGNISRARKIMLGVKKAYINNTL